MLMSFYEIQVLLSIETLSIFGRKLTQYAFRGIIFRTINYNLFQSLQKACVKFQFVNLMIVSIKPMYIVDWNKIYCPKPASS